VGKVCGNLGDNQVAFKGEGVRVLSQQTPSSVTMRIPEDRLSACRKKKLSLNRSTKSANLTVQSTIQSGDMNKKLALALLSSPTIFGSMLSMVVTVNPVHAAEPLTSATDSPSCISNSPASRLTCARFSQTTQIASAGSSTEAQVASFDSSSSEPPMLNFTEEESDAAVQLFGCDCIVCINAIRQMRGLAPVS
jgi:hypothetical protein